MNDVVGECIEQLHEQFDRSDLEIEARKIVQKLEEARYSPGDLGPLVDCIFSILLAARSRGYKSDAVMAELERTAKRYLDRTWKKMPDGTYQAM